MNVKLPYFEKYSIAPSPNRDYYGLKVFANEVILYQWKISHGPHLFPIVRIVKLSEFYKDKAAKELIEHVFGTNVLRYLELTALSGPSTLLTLPKELIEKLVTYLNLKDITELLRTSSISSEVFDTDRIWQILYGQLKGLSDLSEMEKETAANRGFKKLVKDHRARSVAKKSIKLMDDKLKHAQSKNDQVVRSASVNLPKTILQEDVKNVPGKSEANSNSRKAHKPLKSVMKAGSQMKAASMDLPKKSASAEKSSILVGSERSTGKNIAPMELYRTFKSGIEDALTKEPSEKTEAMSKFRFINEDREKTELLLPKKFIKSAIAEAHLSGDSDIPDDLMKSKSMLIDSPKSAFPKVSSHAIGDSKVKSQGRPSKGKKKSTGATAKGQKSVNNAPTSSARNDDKSDDSDESGMSFLMKRYLEASNEVAKKFSECQRLANATKSSGVQVDMSEKADRKPMKKLHKYAPIVDKSTARRKLC